MPFTHRLFAFLFFCAFGKLTAQTIPEIPIGAPAATYPGKASQGWLLGTTAPLSESRQSVGADAKFAVGAKTEKKNYFGRNPLHPIDNAPATDPVRQGPQAEFAPQINPIVNMDGLRNTGATPPDPTGDIGKNHYVQMVNAGGGARMMVLNKQGNVLFSGPSSDLWGQLNTNSVGDPIVQYDHSTDRWFIMEMQGSNELLIGASQTPDPMGAWYVYRFQTEGFPDYPKLYVWDNALFVTVNEIVDGTNKCSGYALQKSSIVSGEASFKLYRFEFPRYQGIAYQPATGADWEAGPPPPAGSPGLIFRMLDNQWTGTGSDKIDIWEIKVDWSILSLSTITGPKSLLPAAFESNVCYGWMDCIDQPGQTGTRLTALDQIIMYRAPYRNFGDYEAIVLNHISDITNNNGVGGVAGMRWYELRRYPGGDWQIFQQGTFAPDQTSRFMGTLTMDGSGNIAAGYAICSDQVYPGIALTGRNAGDPAGVMSVQEYIAAPGQAAHGSVRWGDYSSMTVDPVDDRTFWYTGEYQPSDAFWGTKIIAFQLQKDQFDVSPFSMPAPVSAHTLGASELVSVEIKNYGVQPSQNTTISMWLEGVQIATETISQSIPPDGSYVHTFQTPVDLSVIGKVYTFRFISQMQNDGFILNDTLRTTVRKLTTSDAGLKQQPQINTKTCSSSMDVPVGLVNAAAVPLTSAQISWKVGNNPWQTTQWTGLLESGQTDTTFLPVTNLSQGFNLFSVKVSLPNGNQDQDLTNDSIGYKLFAAANSIYHGISFTNTVGGLKWEVRLPNNTLVAGGSTLDPFTPDLCLDAGICYTLRLIPLNNNVWRGQFALLNSTGDRIFYTEEVLQSFTKTFCITSRPGRDVGPTEIITPETSASLGASELLKVSVRNLGTTAATGVQVSARLNGGQSVTETIPITLVPGANYLHTFQTPYNLSTTGANYQWEIITIWPQDSVPQNDTLLETTRHLPELDGAVTSIQAVTPCSATGPYFLLTLANRGAETIDSVVMEFTLNSLTFFDTLKIPIFSGSERTFTIIQGMGTKIGANSITARVKAINGLPSDFDLSNNTKTSQFDMSADQAPLTILVMANNYAGAAGMSWKLTNTASGQTVAGVGPYADWVTSWQNTECLPLNDCYTLTIYYPGTDGWKGMFDLVGPMGQIFTYSGAPFTDSLVHAFCGLDDCAGLAINLDIQNASSASVNDGKVTMSAVGGTPPYFYGLTPGFQGVDSVFTGLAPGNYTAYLADINFCERQQPFVIQAAVSTQDWFVGKTQITPNPTTDFVWIRLRQAPPSLEKADIVVRDALGRLILHDQMVRWDQDLGGMINLTGHPAGLYLLHFYANGQVWSARVIKQ